MAKLVLVRHGESEWNARGVWTGLTDIGLSEKGKEEAISAGLAIKDIVFQTAFVSVLKRARQTLEEIKKVLGVKIPTIENAALNERDYGDYTGKNKWEVKKEIGDEAFLKLRRSWDYPIPNGESLKEVYERAVPYYKEYILPELKKGKNVLVSAHGNSLRALVKFLDNIPDEKIAELEIPTGQVLVYSIDQNGKVISKDIRGVDFDIEKNLKVFDPVFQKRPEIEIENFKFDLKNYYLPYLQKIIDKKNININSDGLIVGISAIQGTGKTTQAEIIEILLKSLGYNSISFSIDDHYITHEELNKLREKDPRFIRRGVTHDIPLAIKNLTDLKTMKIGSEVKVPIYDKGAQGGDGDRVGWKVVVEKPDFIFYDGWMLGARRVLDESIFESGLPALDTPEHIQFAKDINKKLDEYLPLWDLIEFMNVLYVPNYQISLQWRDQAEEVLRKERKGMSKEGIKEFVYYFWRSVHPAIQIKNLAHDNIHTQQVTIINDDHSVKSILEPGFWESRL